MNIYIFMYVYIFIYIYTHAHTRTTTHNLRSLLALKNELDAGEARGDNMIIACTITEPRDSSVTFTRDLSTCAGSMHTCVYVYMNEYYSYLYVCIHV